MEENEEFKIILNKIEDVKRIQSKGATKEEDLNLISTCLKFVIAYIEEKQDVL